MAKKQTKTAKEEIKQRLRNRLSDLEWDNSSMWRTEDQRAENNAEIRKIEKRLKKEFKLNLWEM